MSTSPQDHSTKRKAPADDQIEEHHTSPNGSLALKRPRVTTAAQTKGATVQKILSDANPTKKRSHKKKTAIPQTAPATNATPVEFPRPWLKRRQTLPEQTVWLIHAHDNLVPGATRPKPWKDVAIEFNEHFKAVLAKPLAHKTLSKRVSDSRAQFLAHNPEYPEKPTYPVPMYDPEADDEEQSAGDEDVAMSEDEQEVDDENRLSDDIWDDEEQQDPDADMRENEEELVQTELPDTVRDTTPLPFEAAHVENDVEDGARSGTPLPVTRKRSVQLPAAQISPVTSALDVSANAPSMYGASSIPEHRISTVDRMKYHLRRRTDEPVAFNFLDLDEDETKTFTNDVQFVDHDILMDVSPTYVRYAHKYPDRPMDVPKGITTKTVNAFCQIIAPVRATQLPTHYLWQSEKPVPGEYDRFGAIEPEKITWSVDMLLELLAFARHMKVLWICDMVIDRLHQMYTEQAKLRDMCRKHFQQTGWMNVNGRQVNVGVHLPSVPDLENRGLTPMDFESEHLNGLLKDPVDEPTLTFVGDVIAASGDELDPEWLEGLSKEVQEIFAAAADAPQDSCLTGAAREDFCARYHHHALNQPCYTANPTPTEQSLLDQLYTTKSHDQLLKLSANVSPPNTLESVVYSQSADMGELLADNSTPEMLEAEKQLLLMEMQLEKAKNAMEEARHAARQDKAGALEAAKKLMWKK